MTKSRDQHRLAQAETDEHAVWQHISQAEANASKDAFLGAIARAKATLGQEDAPKYRPRHWLWLMQPARVYTATGVVALAVLFIGIALFVPIDRHLEAAEFKGMQGLVVSAYNMQPVASTSVGPAGVSGTPISGIEVRRILKKGIFGLQTRLVASTDPQGIFNIPATSDAESNQYELVFNGKQVATFTTGAEEEHVRGYQKFYVDVPPERQTVVKTISVEPGQTVDVDGEFKVSLGPDAKKSWKGKAINDKNWPTNFLFGQVAGGIYKLEGPECVDLRISAFISVAVQQMYDAAPEALTLVSQDQRYFEEESKNKETFWRSRVHRGWYVTNAAPYSFLKQQSLSIASSCGGYFNEPGTWATWEAQPCTPYAILVPPNLSGEATACWIDSESGEEPTLQPAIRLLGRNRMQPLLYDIKYSNPQDGKDYYYNEFVFPPARECYFYNEMEPRGFLNTRFSLPLPEEFAAGEVSGKFWLRLMDFTVDDQKTFGPIVYKASAAPGKYDISFERGAVGEVTRMKLVGDLSQLTQPPDWDFYCDNVIEQRGTDAELSIFQPGSYNIQAIVHEKSGNVILIQRQLLFPPPGVLGYESWVPGFITVAENATAPSAAVSSLRSVSINSVASPSAYGYLASNVLGPAIYLNPPPEYHLTPLKEMRVYIHCRAAGGDAEKMYLEPLITFAKLTKNTLMPVVGQYDGPDAAAYGENLLEAGISYYIDDALAVANNPATRSQLIASLRKTFYYDYSRASLKRVTGIDLDTDQPLADVIARLQAFVNGPYYAVRYATSVECPLQWNKDLLGVTLPADRGFMVRIIINDYNILLAGQWDVYSGGQYPSRIELETAEGHVYTSYYDFSHLAWQGTDTGSASASEAGRPGRP